MYHFYVLVVLLLVAWGYTRWRGLQQYWPRRGVPQRSPYPLLGSLTFLQRKNPGLWMRELYNEFKSPYVGIWVFWRPGLVVNCPEIARKILVKDADVFRNRLLSSGKNDPNRLLNTFTDNKFVPVPKQISCSPGLAVCQTSMSSLDTAVDPGLQDPLWSSLRRRLTRVFTAAKLRGWHALVHKKATELVQRIAADTKNGLTIDLRVTFSDYTTDVIGQAFFGVISDSTLTGNSALRTTTKEAMKYSVWRGLAWSSIFFFPELVNVFGFSFFSKASEDYFKRVFKMIVAERGGYDKPNLKSRDLLDELIKMKHDAAKENEDISEDVLIAQAAIFLQAGFDPSSLVLAYTIYELAYHPQCQEKLFEEISAAKQQLDDKEFDASHLTGLGYLNCVIKETLRKYPIMGWLDRIAEKNYKVDDKLTIEAGTVVYVNAAGMQMDPEYFPEPELYNPDRFLPENEKIIPAFTFMPFGEGPRNCVGKRFGLNTVRYALAQTILSYTAVPIPNAPQPNDCKVEKRGLFFMPDETLSVEFVPRNKPA